MYRCIYRDRYYSIDAKGGFGSLMILRSSNSGSERV